MVAGVRFGAVSEHVLNNSQDPPHPTPPPPDPPTPPPSPSLPKSNGNCLLLASWSPLDSPLLGHFSHRAMYNVNLRLRISVAPGLPPWTPLFQLWVLANPLWTPLPYLLLDNLYEHGPLCVAPGMPPTDSPTLCSP
jgi:hypothetical protein